jgi:hypothetical protein
MSAKDVLQASTQYRFKPVSLAAPLPFPEYIRLPANGQSDPIANLKRSALDKLTRPQECNNWKPPVASKIINLSPGKARGIRLISTASLLEYLRDLPDAGASQKQEVLQEA